MSGTEIKGTQLSPIWRKMAKDAPRRDRSAEMNTLVSKAIEYMGRAVDLLGLRLATLNHAERLPGLGHMRLEDLLARRNPGGIMLLGNPDAAVAEQNGDLLHRHSLLQ